MEIINLSALGPIFPELFLSIVGMLLLIIGVIKGNSCTRCISWLTVLAFAAALFIMSEQSIDSGSILNEMFIHNGFTHFMKILVMGGIIASVALSVQYIHQDNIIKFEYPLLMLFAAIGMMLMISANDMLSLYMGLELQSLSLYVLAAIKRDNLKSAEAGMKYFILGALSSGILLFGISLIYGFTGTTNFDLIGTTLANELSVGAVIGFIFILVGMAFKISAVPFHMWTPDVYQGAPTSVTAFFAVVPKVAAFAVIIRLLFIPFAALDDQWFQIMWLLSLLSMIVGAFAGLRKKNIKRLMAYSSIGNMGYALIGVAAGSEKGIAAVLVYLSLYMVMTIGVFGIILCLRKDGRHVDSISDLAGLSQTSPWLAYPMAIFLFSMAGIPPLAGFFGKLVIFQSAIESGLYTLAILGILTSVVAPFYYLRIIRAMFFDKPNEKLDTTIEFPHKIIIGIALFITVAFIFLPSPLMDVCANAVRELF